MALLAYALTTVALAKTYMKKTDAADDTLIESLINATTVFVENYCGRRFKKTVYTAELKDGNGSQYLFLKHYPIVSVTTIYWTDITVGDTLIDSDDYKIYANQGYIYKAGGWVYGHQNIKITYEAGYTFIGGAAGAVPEELYDLREVVNALVSMLFNNPTKYGIDSEKIGQYSVKFTSPGELIDGLPKDLINRLNFYASQESNVI